MPRTFPFSGLVFDPAVAGPLEVVTAPPYDVIGETERQAFLASSPYSVVHLDLSEGDGRDRYDRAAQLLHRWRAEGALVPLPEPSYLGYEMRFRFQARERTIRGILCALELEEWGGSVLPHERTMPGPVQDRLRLLRATRVDLSAVYGTVAGPVPALASALERVSGGAPLATVVDAEGVTHRLWVVPHTPGLTEALAHEPVLIADGHHRYTTALRYREERRRTDGPGPWDRVLALIVDAGSEEPPVLPIHRVVSGYPLAPLAGVRVRDLQEVLAELDDRVMTVGLVTRENGVLVHAVARLDGTPPVVAALHRVFGATVETERLRYTPDAVGAESAVRSGSASAAYLLPPTTV